MDYKNIIEYHDDLYYNKSSPEISDKEYDKLKEKLNYEKIGHPIKYNSKVKLPYKMGSLKKLKTNKEINNWIKKYNNLFVISEKLDGVSVQIINNNNTYKAYTRGDGEYGRDISKLLEYIDIKLPINWSIRGEFVISKKNFKKNFSKDKNSRNIVSGMVNLKELKYNKYIDFIAFGILYPKFKISEQLKILKENNIKIVNHEIIDNIDYRILYDKLREYKDKSNYDIDGIVCEHDYKYDNIEMIPKHIFSFKSYDIQELKRTYIIDIEWNIQINKSLKPVILINPVIIDNIKISRISGYNAKYIYNNEIGKDTIVEIMRSGDVIPYIYNIVKKTIPLMPNVNFKWDENKVNIFQIDNIDENKISLLKNNYFFKCLNIENIGIGILKKLQKFNYIDLFDILEGFKKKLFFDILGEKNSLKILNNINDVFNKDISLSKLMSASKLFESNIAEKKINKILDKYPNILEIDNISEDDLNNIDGIHNKTSEQFLKHLPEFKIFMDKLNSIYKLKISSKNSAIEIVFSGFRSKEYHDILEKKGYNVVNNITKNTKLLVYNKKNTTKFNYAIKNNINTISKEEFIKKLIN